MVWKAGRPPMPRRSIKVDADLSSFPAGAAHFLRRADEIAALDAAWADAGHTRVVTLIAPGGTGKTPLMRDWLLRPSQDDWCGAQRVYAWSFYSQGTSDDRQASEDSFLAAAIAWFGIAGLPELTDAEERAAKEGWA